MSAHKTDNPARLALERLNHMLQPLPALEACDHPKGLFEAYVADTLSDEDRADLESHIDACEGCAKELDLLWNLSLSWTKRLRDKSKELASQHRQSAEPTRPTRPFQPRSPIRRSRRKQDELPFAVTQTKVEGDQKELLGQWLAFNHLTLSSGSGVFLDAGSTALKYWEVGLRPLLEQGKPEFLYLGTSNFMVLKAASEWLIKHPEKTVSLSLVMYGDEYDYLHQSFTGRSGRRKLMSGEFQPEVAVIGTSGIEFSNKRILFGYHSPDEKVDKETLFRFPCKKRIILAHASKIGNAGGQVFDMLSMNRIDSRAPIELITTKPEGGTEDEQRFNQSVDMFLSSTLQNAIRDRGIKFRWLVVSRDPMSGEMRVGPISADMPDDTDSDPFPRRPQNVEGSR